MRGLTLLLIATTLSACATGIPQTNSACVSFAPITPTKADWATMSPVLYNQITLYDAAWDKLCSKDPLRP